MGQGKLVSFAQKDDGSNQSQVLISSCGGSLPGDCKFTAFRSSYAYCGTSDFLKQNTAQGTTHIVFATITISVGAFAPSATGKPGIDERAPVAEFNAKPEILLSTLFTT